MSNLSTEKDPNLKSKSDDGQVNVSVLSEWKPDIRTKKKDESPKQKIRMRDLAPDKQYIKEVIDNESRYFLLIIIPVVVIALFTAIQRDDLYNRLIAFIVAFLSNS